MRRIAKVHLVALVALVAAGALTFAACGDDDDDDDNQTTAATVAATEGATEAPHRGEGRVILATTTSTVDSGLLEELEPVFQEETGYDLQVVGVGSGAALEMGRNGDADVLLVHSPEAEDQFVADDFAERRLQVMYNDFVIVGPEDDPAGIASASSAADAFRRIQESESPFISRGDDSGTHARELSIWEEAGIEPSGGWYSESGQGMGATLTIADEREAYTLSDRGTFLALQDDLALTILVEGDPSLLNQYHVITLNAERHPDIDINTEGADAFADFLVSEETQAMIGEFGVEEFGQPLFVANAGAEAEEPTAVATTAQ